MNKIKIAWRNLWRNRRRTFITVASIFFGVLISTLMSSLQDGTYGNMIDMMVKLSSGYIQIQDPDYQENKSINNTFSPTQEMLEKINGVDKVTRISQRLESFALMSSGPNTRGGAVIGFEPEKDKYISNLQNWIDQGRFLKKGDQGVLLSSNIAKHLGLTINDTLVLISQGYHGVTAAGLYPVRGILKFATPQLNNIGVFMDISTAQEFYSAYGKVSSLMIMVEGYADVPRAEKELNQIIKGKYAVLNWQELNPEIVQFLESDKAGAVVMKAILYIVIGFGIFGTIIMMVAERRRELGVMVAVGMQKIKLSLILFYETLWIGIIGVITGFLASIPVILFLVEKPIPLPEELAQAYLQYGFEPYLFFGTAPSVFINQALTVFIITMIISFYPVFKVKNLKITKALRA
ncbi:MAG: ABC transporter permease [Bacteroidales bacterium]|jgi:ABC-type lipoprotein release transport system permease subunit|nr:ABC transporter permease [Bacteroidales bacterium]